METKLSARFVVELRIKELREEKNLTQKMLAERIGYNQSNIARWERGEQEPSLGAVVRLAQFFEVSTDYLLGLVD